MSVHSLSLVLTLKAFSVCFSSSSHQRATRISGYVAGLNRSAPLHTEQPQRSLILLMQQKFQSLNHLSGLNINDNTESERSRFTPTAACLLKLGCSFGT